MKHLLISFLLLTTNAFAQGPFGDYAVVKDKDGYVNIRAKENVKSKIVGTLPNNTLIYNFLNNEDIPNPSNWVYEKNGYIHKSRLKKVEDFPSIGKGKEQGNSITIAGKGISVTLTKQPFDQTKHKITKKKYKYYEELIIDGKSAQGTDTSFIPEDHYKSIIVTINGKNVSIPKSAYDDLYEVAMYTDNNAVYYDKEEDTIYIIAHNGSGANAYEVCWQIVKGEYKTRIIGEPF